MGHFANIFRRSFGGMADRQALSMLMLLIHRHDHTPDVERMRATMILARVHLISLIFGVLTVLWMVVDAVAFEASVWQPIALCRIAAAFAFFALAVYTRGIKALLQARVAMALMYIIPTAFYVVTWPFLADVEPDGWSQMVFMGYALLPFIIVGGLSFLPITLFEGVSYFTPLMIVKYMIQTHMVGTIDVYALLGFGWLLLLLSIAATCAGMSQLQLIIELARQASADPLTGTYVRRVGQELFDAQYNVAERQDSPFTIAFADIDDFKSVNDQFGHDIGDKVLRQTADHIHDNLRKSDLLVRWGGEEFLLIMPNTDHEGAAHMIERLYENGLGLRPDGSALTISMGVAERQADHSETWEELLVKADARMYEAKAAGKNRYVADASHPA